MKPTIVNSVQKFMLFCMVPLCMFFALPEKASAQQLTAPVITVLAGNQNVVVSWNNVPGATSYILYWGTRSGINTVNMYSMKAQSVTSPYTQMQLANGVEYFFIVQAVNGTRSSNASNVASATPSCTSPLPVPIVIRPFGDSITYGLGFADGTYCPVYANGQQPCPDPPVNWGGGYRGWMAYILKNSRNIVYTTEGQQSGGSNQFQYATATQRHDGYPGATTIDLISKSKMASSADVTLVHAGTNDIFWRVVLLRNCGWPVNPIADSLFVSVRNILAANAKTKVYVAKIVKFAAGTMVLPSVVDSINIKVDQYNQQIVRKWNELPTQMKERVSIVDMSSVLSSTTDYISDGVHPSREGYLKMACAWIRAINGMPLDTADQCACITTNAVTRLMPHQR